MEVVEDSIVETWGLKFLNARCENDPLFWGMTPTSTHNPRYLSNPIPKYKRVFVSPEFDSMIY